MWCNSKVLKLWFTSKQMQTVNNMILTLTFFVNVLSLILNVNDGNLRKIALFYVLTKQQIK